MDRQGVRDRTIKRPPLHKQAFPLPKPLLKDHYCQA